MMTKKERKQNMIEKHILQKLIHEGLQTGADFVEIFIEDSISKQMMVTNGDVSQLGTANVHGVGVRIIQGVDEVYGYTNEVSEKAILDVITNLRETFDGEKKQCIPLGEKQPFVKTATLQIEDVTNDMRAKTLIELSLIMKNHDPRIVQAIAQLIEKRQSVLIANSKGVYQDDVRTYTRAVVQAVASENGVMQYGYEAPGRFAGFELFDLIDFKALAKEAATSAITLLSAEEIEPQVMPVILNNGFGGVIFHEACGHPLEATAVAKGLSPFVGKLGEKVGSDVVTAYDDGNVDGAWGRLSFDDEGKKTQKNLLIENGVLKGYLVDYRRGMIMGMDATGSARRQSYKFPPTSRMNSTYIAPGNDKLEDMIKETKHGLFAKKLGGGTVSPATGEFNFAVLEGYMIKDGVITKPVRGAMLIGHGKDVLFKIDRVGSNLELGQGMCGSISGSIPVDVGQPPIRVQNMTVGGAGGTK